MSIKSDLILISLICLFVLIESQIGSYPALNTDGCGVTRLSMNDSNECFKWHNNGITDEMKDGRTVTTGEVPWLVMIEQVWTISNGTYTNTKTTFCTGSLFKNNWVITAAHCFGYKKITPAGFNVTKGPYYTIFSGVQFVYSVWERQWKKLQNNSMTWKQYQFFLTREDIVVFNVTKWHLHPNYTQLNVTLKDEHGNYVKEEAEFDDIALLKLNASISPSVRRNNICLPKADYIEDNNTYLVSAGYGGVGNPNANSRWPAQIGYWRAVHTLDAQPLYLAAYAVEKGALMCSGDSGGPLWKYDTGRAVALGLVSFGATDNSTKCAFPHTVNHHTRVSSYINWISEVIKSDTRGNRNN